MTSASFISSASDRDHDLEPVAVGDAGARVHALRHDLAVALDRDLLARKKHFLEQGAERERMLEALRRTVDGDLNHGRILLPISAAKINVIAGVVQWQNGSFPSCIRVFES